MVKDNIKRICKEQGRTISEIEQQAGISKGHIHHLRNPRLSMLKDIASALDVTVEDLIREEDQCKG